MKRPALPRASTWRPAFFRRRRAGKAEMVRLAEVAWEQRNYATVVILLSPFKGSLDFDSAQRLALAEVRAELS
ncbi:hypothetical protein [Aeromicrobium stalagmiti]|uniref:hypothetical protein n=1 Tax=Aeromicrobium stalagmiti TaxID=2738988 RepID=UPI00156963DE|nr:hypothetical protein [Aeromicrobium stalagmiti]NRQ49582.1 hypothetical protein [Aeromicrobium stalagmiti]